MKKRAIRPWMIPAAASVPVLIFALVLIAAALSSDGSEYFIPSLKYGAVFPPAEFTLLGISPYNLMQIVGAALGAYMVIKYRELFCVSMKQAIIITAVLYIQAIIGVKLLFAIQECIGTGDLAHWNFGGASLYGAIFGMAIVFAPLAAIMKLPKKDVGSIFMLAGAIFLAFGRLGCFLSGCCGSRLFYIGEHPIFYPVQLIEAFFDLVIAAVLYARCFSAREKGSFFVGAMPVGLIMYGAVRFLLEYVRTNPLTRIGLTEAQIHSLMIIAAGAGMWIYAARKNSAAGVPAERKSLRIKPGAWLIPAIAAVPVAVFAIFLVIQALSSDGGSYAYPFIVYGGAVKPVGAKILGLALYRAIDALGAAAGVATGVLFARKKGVGSMKAFAFAVNALLVGFAGGKVLFFIENMYDIGHFRLDFGGQSLFGVLYFALIFTPLIAHVYGLKKRTAYDITALMWLVGLTIARVGCIFSGCCGGKTFMAGSSPVTFPAQLTEIFCDLLILAFVLHYTGRKRKNGEKYLGAFPIFLMSYSAVRFLLEFVRTNHITHLGTTEAQKHALLLLFAGVIMALRAKPYEAPVKKEKKKKALRSVN